MTPLATSTDKRPKVGVGIILRRSDGMVLQGKRKNCHAPYWSIPGGHVEAGESFEQAARREMLEETGLVIDELTVIGITNNLDTYAAEGVHSISVCLVADYNGGEIRNMEPDKCEGWSWFLPTELPQPQFDASEQSIYCLLNGVFYHPTT